VDLRWDSWIFAGIRCSSLKERTQEELMNKGFS
jgi:hypothetical protein